jgi:flagellar basal-body rod protein FlgC
MSIFNSLNISGSALSAERQRSEVAVTNLANVDTTRTSSGKGPYRRREVVLESTGGAQFQSLLNDGSTSMPTSMPTSAQPGGVRLTRVVEDKADPIRRYDPGHPDADKDGYVSYPAINPAQEMVDLMGSVRAYQLNASAIAASKQMIEQSIDILKS